MPASEYVMLRYGYTLADIENLARAAVRRDVFHQSLPFPDRLDIAWSAIAEHLYGCDRKPERSEMVRAAWNALRAEAEGEWHTHGLARGLARESSVFDGDQTMRNYWRYWFPFYRNTQSPEERIVERTALYQIWAVLPEHHRRVLSALAEHDDYGKAAEALGKTRSNLVTRLAIARRAFRELWHEGETPSGHWGTDRRRNPDTEANRRWAHNSRMEFIRRKRRRRERERQLSANGQGTA